MRTPAETESVLLVPVPETRAIAHEYRRRFDASAAAGIPEHITLLYPFVHPIRLDAEVRTRLRTLLGQCQPFAFQLTAVRWFESGTMWLAPEPAAGFVHLTRLLSREFGVLPYRGAYPDITPHLTVATDTIPEAARAMQTVIAAKLPVAATAKRVDLMVGAPGGLWRVDGSFPLGGVHA